MLGGPHHSFFDLGLRQGQFTGMAQRIDVVPESQSVVLGVNDLLAPLRSQGHVLVPHDVAHDYFVLGNAFTAAIAAANLSAARCFSDGAGGVPGAPAPTAPSSFSTPSNAASLTSF